MMASIYSSHRTIIGPQAGLWAASSETLDDAEKSVGAWIVPSGASIFRLLFQRDDNEGSLTGSRRIVARTMQCEKRRRFRQLDLIFWKKNLYSGRGLAAVADGYRLHVFKFSAENAVGRRSWEQKFSEAAVNS
jgi:hypothetical protein